MAAVIEDEVIKAEFQASLSHIDENLVIDNFSTVFEKNTRKLRVHFTVVNRENGQSVEINNVY